MLYKNFALLSQKPFSRSNSIRSCRGRFFGKWNPTMPHSISLAASFISFSYLAWLLSQLKPPSSHHRLKQKNVITKVISHDRLFLRKCFLSLFFPFKFHYCDTQRVTVVFQVVKIFMAFTFSNYCNKRHRLQIILVFQRSGHHKMNTMVNFGWRNYVTMIGLCAPYNLIRQFWIHCF